MRMDCRIYNAGAIPHGNPAMLPTTACGTTRKPTNVTLDDAPLAEAGLARVVAERLAAQWLKDNRAALDSSNTYVEQQGLPLTCYRNF